jgi:hypothetical protein
MDEGNHSFEKEDLEWDQPQVEVFHHQMSSLSPTEDLMLERYDGLISSLMRDWLEL